MISTSENLQSSPPDRNAFLFLLVPLVSPTKCLAHPNYLIQNPALMFDLELPKDRNSVFLSQMPSSMGTESQKVFQKND
jgi:hypothetical protein